ncbi:hypothetical protein BU15DRAFT_87863 [Melanogaster broomeanus]|nr:hypothetical protein BU15DRAFT_87863 [Melanogaster broomeanus]
MTCLRRLDPWNSLIGVLVCLFALRLPVSPLQLVQLLSLVGVRLTAILHLVFNAAVFGIELAVFTLLRPYFKQIYEPRTVTSVEQPFKTGMFTWPIALFKADYRDIQRVNGPDAYLFVRFLRVMIRVFLPIWLISWAVLLPVTSVNNSLPGVTGLDLFTFGNVEPTQQNRFAAQIILVWIFTFWIYWNIRHEMRHFLTVRQLHLVDPTHSRSAQANTVLYLSEQALGQLYSRLPGGVKKVWINRDLKQLPGVYDSRLAACGKLESAETSLLATAAKIRAKTVKKSGNTDDNDADQAERNVSLAERLVPRDRRPTHRLPAGPLPFSLPFIGKKVDTIEWCRTEIATMTTLLRQARRTVTEESHLPDVNKDAKVDAKETYPPLSSAFVTFNQQISAHMAYRMLAHHEPYRMSDRFLEVAPDDVLWSNLGMNPYEKRVRMVISYAATAALIIFWAIPVSFVGFISNIEVGSRGSATIPAVVLGIIQGILPPVLLAVLMMLLPIVLRFLARFEGIPTRTGLELSLMTRYFIFQVIHSFLIVTLSSGIAAALPGLLQNPSSVATLLAQSLPQASTFFPDGLSGSAGSFLAAVQLVLYYAKLYILGSTPRSVFNIKFGPRTVAWGTLFPSITLLTVITLGYSIISPIINGLAVLAFFLFYQLYKYLFLYQYTQPPTADTGGLFYPKALQHVFVGLYVQQICLCALFFLSRDANGKASAVPQGILMVVLILLTTYKSDEPLESDASSPIDEREKRRETMDSSQVPSPSQPRPSRSIGRESIQEQPLMLRSHSAQSGGSSPTSLIDDCYFARHPDGKFDYGFAHPALTRPQRIVWIPEDTLGLGKEEVRANDEMAVLATTQAAKMDAKGWVEVMGPPVDLEKF